LTKKVISDTCLRVITPLTHLIKHPIYKVTVTNCTTVQNIYHCILHTTSHISETKQCHSKQCWVVSTQRGSNMDKPMCWVKNVIKKFTVESECYKLHFNPTFGFVHILPKFGLKQPSID